MNLKAYYSKVRETEAEFAGDDVLIVSEVTPDGGKAGVLTLVTKRAAAQLIVEGRARAANNDERVLWEMEEAERREEMRRDEIAQRIQVQVIADPDSRARVQ